MVVDQAVPLYRIKAYENYLYRVTKRLFNPNKVKVKQSHEPKEKSVGKFDSALSRAKNTVREVCLCNRWEYFVTLTFNDSWDRYDLKQRVKELMQYIQNLNKEGYSIKYVLIPEFHKDGAVHFHGLMSGIPVSDRPEWWPRSVNLKSDGTYYQHCPLFSDRYGFSSVGAVGDGVACGFYVSKYITKSMAEKADLKGVHTYYRSHGLRRSVEIGSLYHGSVFLDKCCKFSNSFYSFGFFKFEDVGSVVDLCDEVNVMYQNYLITDPVSGEVVGVVGGDTEDVYIQEILSEFLEQGLSCNPYDFPD